MSAVRRRTRAVVRTLLAFALAAGASACTRPIARAAAPEAQPTDTYVALYRRLEPSVVLFTMLVPSDDPKHRGGFDEAYGTGMVVASGGWGSRILTDAHVIAGAHAIVVHAGSHRKAPARVVAVSNDRDDVAIVETVLAHLPAVPLGSAGKVAAGEPIAVMGYPIPDAFEDEHLVTRVSIYTGRVASVRNDALELDAPIIPGESGGPVIDALTGAIVGIAESRFDEEKAIGFATPIDVAVRFLDAHPLRVRTAAAAESHLP